MKLHGHELEVGQSLMINGKERFITDIYTQDNSITGDQTEFLELDNLIRNYNPAIQAHYGGDTITLKSPRYQSSSATVVISRGDGSMYLKCYSPRKGNHIWTDQKSEARQWYWETASSLCDRKDGWFYVDCDC